MVKKLRAITHWIWDEIRIYMKIVRMIKKKNNEHWANVKCIL